jgi:hypothetical protein
MEQQLYLLGENLLQGHLLQVQRRLFRVRRCHMTYLHKRVSGGRGGRGTRQSVGHHVVHARVVSPVCSAMNARFRCCWPDAGGMTLVMAATKDLWSVHSWNCLPSSWGKKLLMAACAAAPDRRWSSSPLSPTTYGRRTLTAANAPSSSAAVFCYMTKMIFHLLYIPVLYCQTGQ